MRALANFINVLTKIYAYRYIYIYAHTLHTFIFNSIMHNFSLPSHPLQPSFSINEVINCITVPILSSSFDFALLQSFRCIESKTFFVRFFCLFSLSFFFCLHIIYIVCPFRHLIGASAVVLIKILSAHA